MRISTQAIRTTKRGNIHTYTHIIFFRQICLFRLYQRGSERVSESRGGEEEEEEKNTSPAIVRTQTQCEKKAVRMCVISNFLVLAKST